MNVTPLILAGLVGVALGWFFRGMPPLNPELGQAMTDDARGRLERLAAKNGLTHVATLRKALQLFELVLTHTQSGQRVLLETQDGSTVELKLD